MATALTCPPRSLLAVEHVEEDGKAMLYLVRGAGAALSGAWCSLFGRSGV